MLETGNRILTIGISRPQQAPANVKRNAAYSQRVRWRKVGETRVRIVTMEGGKAPLYTSTTRPVVVGDDLSPHWRRSVRLARPDRGLSSTLGRRKAVPADNNPYLKHSSSL